MADADVIADADVMADANVMADADVMGYLELGMRRVGVHVLLNMYMHIDMNSILQWPHIAYSLALG